MTELADLIRELRVALYWETPIRLHAGAFDRGQRTTKRAVPEDDQSHASGGSTWRPEHAAGYGTQVGLPFTTAFERRLSHPDWWGINEIAEHSIREVGDWCRSRHLSDLHRCPGRSTSLCERIVSALCEFGHPLGQVAWREGVDEKTAYALAVQAIRHAKSWRHRQLHMYMRAARELERDTRVICPLCLGKSVMMRPGRVA